MFLFIYNTIQYQNILWEACFFILATRYIRNRSLYILLYYSVLLHSSNKVYLKLFVIGSMNPLTSLWLAPRFSSSLWLVQLILLPLCDLDSMSTQTSLWLAPGFSSSLWLVQLILSPLCDWLLDSQALPWILNLVLFFLPSRNIN